MSFTIAAAPLTQLKSWHTKYQVNMCNGMQSVDFAQLVACAGDAIVVSDHDGAITVWNRAAERVFGFSEAEALGQSLDLITPERHRQRHWSGYAETMRTGETRYGADVLRVPALHKDGRPLSIAFTVGMLFDEAGAVTGIAAVIRDETLGFAENRKMRARLAELEAKLASTPVEPASAQPQTILPKNVQN